MIQSVPRNALVAIAQVLVTGAVLFLLYRYLLTQIGVEKLGVWSIVMAAVSASKVAQLGFSGSTIKYVAKYLALKDSETVSRVIQTSVLTTVVFLGVVTILAYPVLRWVLMLYVPDTGVTDSLQLLPYSLVTLWLGGVAAVFQAGLDGCQRVDVRGYLVIVAYMIYFGIAVFLVDKFGLVGLAYAQVIQGAFLLVAGWYVLKRVMPFLPIFPKCWHRCEFREMLNYGLNFQFVSILQILYDPVTKLLIGNFGGLAVTGYYEMANRMVLQLRTLLVSANQVLVPVIASAHEHDAKYTTGIYHKSYRVTFFVAAPYFCAVIALAPFISIAWVGRYETVFVATSVMLSIAWWINTLSSPAYFQALGVGVLRWVVASYVIIAIINITVGYGLGVVQGGDGPILAWAIALSVGSLWIIMAHVNANSIPLKTLLPRESLPLLVASLVVAGASHGVYRGIESVYLALIVILAAAFIGVLPFVVLHPIGRAVLQYVLSKINRSSAT